MREHKTQNPTARPGSSYRQAPVQTLVLQAFLLPALFLVSSIQKLTGGIKSLYGGLAKANNLS